MTVCFFSDRFFFQSNHQKIIYFNLLTKLKFYRTTMSVSIRQTNQRKVGQTKGMSGHNDYMILLIR